jgi:hypothetical protein
VAKMPEGPIFFDFINPEHDMQVLRSIGHEDIASVSYTRWNMRIYCLGRELCEKSRTCHESATIG